MGLKVLLATLMIVLGTGAAAHGAETITPELIAKAKAEGEVVWYSTLPIPETQAWSSLFTKRYGIKVSIFRSGATGMTQKLQTEIPAGRWGFDIVMNRVTNIELYRKKNWLQKLNYPERDRFIEGFIDPDDYWGTYYMQYWVISYNTELVKPHEVPKNYDEILSPRWKGMTTFDEQDVDLYATLMKIMGREKAREWFKKLVANGLRPRQGHTMEVQLVSAGEFALGLSTYASIAEIFRARGAPVDWVAFEPIPVNVLGLAISAKPPHPNAARLFMYWGLSAEGLKAMNDISDRVPARRDVPIKNKRLERLMQRKLMPVDLTIADKYAEYNREFLSLLGLKN
jgi:iron(III) transport system substrate-binding protein